MTNFPISAEKMAAYRAFARKRQQQKANDLHDRHQLGLAVARQAADLLKRDFRAEKVVLFGSMLSVTKIHERSDVDLAVWGIRSEDYYQALGRLLALDPRISIDVVEAELAPARILSEIEATGKIL